MPHASSLMPSFFAGRPSALPQEIVAVPRGIERRIELVNSDEKGGGFVESAGLHLRPGQEVDGVQRLWRGLVRLDDLPEAALGVGKAALLVGAERFPVVVRRPASRRRRGLDGR